MWIRVNAQWKENFNDMKAENLEKWEGMEFKGSYRWMRQFIKHKNIKSTAAQLRLNGLPKVLGAGPYGVWGLLGL